MLLLGFLFALSFTIGEHPKWIESFLFCCLRLRSINKEIRMQMRCLQNQTRRRLFSCGWKHLSVFLPKRSVEDNGWKKAKLRKKVKAKKWFHKITAINHHECAVWLMKDWKMCVQAWIRESFWDVPVKNLLFSSFLESMAGEWVERLMMMEYWFSTIALKITSNKLMRLLVFSVFYEEKRQKTVHRFLFFLRVHLLSLALYVVHRVESSTGQCPFE